MSDPHELPTELPAELPLELPPEVPPEVPPHPFLPELVPPELPPELPPHAPFIPENVENEEDEDDVDWLNEEEEDDDGESTYVVTRDRRRLVDKSIPNYISHHILEKIDPYRPEMVSHSDEQVDHEQQLIVFQNICF